MAFYSRKNGKKDHKALMEILYTTEHLFCEGRVRRFLPTGRYTFRELLKLEIDHMCKVVLLHLWGQHRH